MSISGSTILVGVIGSPVKHSLSPGGPAHGDEERFVEIWNLVFMQFEQHPDGSTTPLPSPAIDTGLGLERILTVMQGVDSVWETDEISRIIKEIGELAGVSYGKEERSDISMRIIVVKISET